MKRTTEGNANRGTWKDRLGYFWMFYKIPVILVIIALAVVLSFVHARLTEPKDGLQVMMLDAHTNIAGEEIASAFAAYEQIDTDNFGVTVSAEYMLSDSSSGNYAMSSLAKFYTEIGTGDLDVAMLTTEDYGKYAESDAFLDLREVFTEEELETFTHLYTNEEGEVLGIYGDCLAGIEECEAYTSDEGRGIIGIIYASSHTETAADFIEFLRDGGIQS